MAEKRYWDRLADESPTQYNAFVIYRDMGPGNRSIDRALQAHRENGGKGGLSTWREWSSRNSWIARVAEYDDFCMRAVRKKMERDRIDMLYRHARIGRSIAAKGLERLLGDSKKGIPAIAAIDIDAGVALALIGSGVKIERGAVGEPDLTVELTDPVDLTDEQKEAKVIRLLLSNLHRADEDPD